MTKEEFYEKIKTECPNICQVFAYRNGQKIFSETWNGYSSDDCVHVMSVTKTVVALLIGIALDKKLIDSIDDKVLKYFPDYVPKRGEKTIQEVTIRHLMTMRAPYKCKGDPWTKVCTSDNWAYTSLDFLGGRKGLTGEFNYQTVCLHILTGLLYKVSGQTTVEFANKYLFRPLGIKDRKVFYAKNAEEHKEFTISKLPRDKVWFSDPQNIGTAGYGLCLNAEEMAKLGLLCLNGGKVKEQQLISKKWLKQMVIPMVVENEWYRGMKYGLLTWIIDENKKIYAAVGNSGNVILLDVKQNLVVSVASSFKPTVVDRVDYILKEIEPFLLTL